jgi:hypothetical protein
LTAVHFHLQDVTNLNVQVPIRSNRPLIYTTHTHTHTHSHTYTLTHTHTHTYHSAMNQAVGGWTEARVQPQSRSCGIYGRSGTGTSVSRSISIFLYSYHSTSAPHSFINHRHRMSATASVVKQCILLKSTHDNKRILFQHKMYLLCLTTLNVRRH